jgi:hypothetical protein
LIWIKRKFQDCTEHGPIKEADLKGWGVVMAGNGGLAVTIPRDDWGFLLRRTDLKPDEVFLVYHGREIPAREVARFLPNWATLRWVRVPDGLLTKSESTAIDGEFQVTVRAEPLSGKHHEAVIDAFIGFMAQPGP